MTKTTEQYSPVLLFIMRHKVVPTLIYHSNESCRAKPFMKPCLLSILQGCSVRLFLKIEFRSLTPLGAKRMACPTCLSSLSSRILSVNFQTFFGACSSLFLVLIFNALYCHLVSFYNHRIKEAIFDFINRRSALD